MTATALRDIKHLQIGKVPVVVLPLARWREVETILEDYEMMRSLKFRKSIEESRKQIKRGKTYQFDLKTGKFKRARKR